ncbi:c-type cytochrome [Campylobacter geochelonis]|uniref:c-type cytochrome n=1 Tax=Campylobacter geochelonis TaxID=1780362 RepID=UPI00077076FA|nr:hypothetical protein [Campylobacter geochelonis]CZE46025.1 Uncharacterised protein [Campylobacter geochelonis]
MKKIVFMMILALLLASCEKKEQKTEQNTSFKNQNSLEQNEPQKAKIVIKKGDEKIKNDDKFIVYNIDGERKVQFNINNENNETTREIIAYARLKSSYKNINLDLLKKRLSPNFILKCSACHNDYANGIIGPSLLDKTDKEIVKMIKKYQSKTQKNVLMYELISKMSDEEISNLADEIYEFNKQFKELE